MTVEAQTTIMTTSVILSKTCWANTVQIATNSKVYQMSSLLIQMRKDLEIVSASTILVKHNTGRIWRPTNINTLQYASNHKTPNAKKCYASDGTAEARVLQPPVTSA
jgi:hypothetical protein